MRHKVLFIFGELNLWLVPKQPQTLNVQNNLRRRLNLNQAMDYYLQRLPRVMQHVADLLDDRGYEGFPFSEATDAPVLGLSKGCSIGEAISCVVKHRVTGANLHVCFLDPLFDVVKNKEIMTSSYQLHGLLTDLPSTAQCLVITYAKLSPDASNEASKLKKRMQVLTFKQLAFSLGKHVLVPKHVALSSAEALEFEESRKLQRNKLPHLKQSDPVRIWYGWPKGTIVRIERPTGVIWRCVH